MQKKLLKNNIMILAEKLKEKKIILGYSNYMYMSELLLDYIEHIEVEKGRSSHTAENYSLYLERFIEFANDIEVEKITSEIIRKYRIWLNRYKNKRLVTIKLPTVRIDYLLSQ